MWKSGCTAENSSTLGHEVYSPVLFLVPPPSTSWSSTCPLVRLGNCAHWKQQPLPRRLSYIYDGNSLQPTPLGEACPTVRGRDRRAKGLLIGSERLRLTNSDAGRAPHGKRPFGPPRDLGCIGLSFVWVGGLRAACPAPRSALSTVAKPPTTRLNSGSRGCTGGGRHLMNAPPRLVGDIFRDRDFAGSLWASKVAAHNVRYWGKKGVSDLITAF